MIRLGLRPLNPVGLLTLLLAAGLPARAAPIDVPEAIPVAQAWLTAELSNPHLGLTPAELAARQVALKDPAVTVLASDGRWLDTPPTGADALGYVVSFPVGGYVLLTADDRLEPVLAFSALDPFRGDDVPENYLRKYVAHQLPDRWKALRDQLAAGAAVPEHPRWVRLRAALADGEPLDLNGAGDERGTYVLWGTPLWDQGSPYNALCAAQNGGYNVPTGCTATAMAIKMRFHSWPPIGSGSHSYQDHWGSIQYYHSVNFGASTYNWANMPGGNVTQPNADVAQIMYHAGVAVDMNYELGASGAWPHSAAMNNYFRYRDTIEIWSENPGDHQPAIVQSLYGGLPVVLSTNDHTLVAAGYRQSPSPYFYLNCGWSGASNGWYNLDGIPGGSPTIEESLPYCTPGHRIYVDGAWNGSELGSLLQPYNTVGEGNAAVPTGGQLWIKGGTYTGAGNIPTTFNRAMTVVGYEGVVTIGP